MAKSKYTSQMREISFKLDSIRKNDGTDITLQQYVKCQGDSMDFFYDDINVDPRVMTVANIMALPDPSVRWLIPEIYRDALRLGLRRGPIYPSLLASEEKVSQLTVTMPAINMSDAAPKKVGIAETIPLGEVSYGSKSVKITKFGRGLQFPYELTQYVSLNILSIYLQDFGVKLGLGLDCLALDTLINGDQSDGSDSAPVIGIASAGTLVYRDLLNPFVRLARMGKSVTTMVSGELMALDMLDILYSSGTAYSAPRMNLNVKTPIPASADLFIHGKIPTNQVLMIDPRGSLIKLNAQPLLLESEKIISNQTNEIYATISTGFATIFRDSRIILDRSLAFSSNGFPTYMDPTKNELVDFNAR